ncbi:hypothetical protein P4S83_03735 [Aneurinibacillus thermoaerophilus]|uniref:hypothetical protein n=1 Tax=Aneurinibacillus thermoaerophilus TaxID=143495 RepID=UPI002E22AE42|nr:hypothetical protein [Aneurinibacillus thermoaerophilus]MED0766397.1 hypothetical protein [Aneurinibacillus thermoaerophilus]
MYVTKLKKEFSVLPKKKNKNLRLYGIIPTLQNFPSFGRVYAAYGGIFIIVAVLWGWGIDKKTPDMYEWGWFYVVI